MSKKYLINLSGQGDQYYFVVGPAAFNWIDSPRPTNFKDYAVQEAVPADVLAELPKLPKTVHVTTGSCENDRAIFLMEGFAFKEIYDRYPAKKGPFDDEWTGCIY